MLSVLEQDTEDVFEMHSRERIKGKRGEVIYSKEKYAQQMYEMYNLSIKQPNIGSVVNGSYIGEQSGDYVFDFGFKDFIRVPKNKNENFYMKEIEKNKHLDVYITDISNTPYEIKGSISYIFEEKAHEFLRNLTTDESVNIRINAVNTAGYEVDILHDGLNVPAFMPNTLAGANRILDPSTLIGKEMMVAVESFSEDRGTYIVSRKRYLKFVSLQEIKNLNYGQLYLGKITGKTEFGIFVEFNECLTGMIHRSNINPAFKMEEIEPGMKIEFFIKEIIKDKLILTQVLRENLWDVIKDNQVFENVLVRDIKNIGALISLDDETNGLIHVNEMRDLKTPLVKGDRVTVRVKSIDRSTRKIYLII